MIYFFGYLILFLWLATCSAQAGYSMTQFGNKLQSWQQKIPHGNRIPEILVGCTIGFIGVWCSIRLFGIEMILDVRRFDWQINFIWLFGLFFGLIYSLISFAGKESATVGYLQHEGSKKDTNGDGVVDNDDARKNSLAPWNQWLSSLFGWQNGDEGYSWVWAFTKGFITTLPVFCLGAIFQPIGREIASHAKGRLPGDSNFYMEFFGDGFGYSTACFIAILFAAYFGV